MLCDQDNTSQRKWLTMLVIARCQESAYIDSQQEVLEFSTLSTRLITRGLSGVTAWRTGKGWCRGILEKLRFELLWTLHQSFPPGTGRLGCWNWDLLWMVGVATSAMLTFDNSRFLSMQHLGASVLPTVLVLTWMRMLRQALFGVYQSILSVAHNTHVSNTTYKSQQIEKTTCYWYMHLFPGHVLRPRYSSKQDYTWRLQQSSKSANRQHFEPGHQTGGKGGSCFQRNLGAAHRNGRA